MSVTLTYLSNTQNNQEQDLSRKCSAWKDFKQAEAELCQAQLS